MKTIDEVIKAVHHCGLLTGFDDTYEYDGGCPYEDCSKCEQKRMLGKDIIQYLAAYKDDRDDLTALRAYWAEQQANPALTWEQLKQMTGKPIWVEFFYEDGQHFDSNWFLVGFVSESFCDVIGKLGTSRLVKKDYWQAYRKERANENLG